MQHSRSLKVVRWVLALGLLVAAMWLFTLSRAPTTGDKALRVPPLAQQLPAAQPTAAQALSLAEATDRPTPIYTLPPDKEPTDTPGPNTPTPAVLQAAMLSTPASVTEISHDASFVLSEKATVNATEPIHSLTWAPTGDKLLYVTAGGGLYWSNLDGSNATLLYTYPFDRIWSMLREQTPLTNTLIVYGGYMVQFAAGQAPTLQAAPATDGVYDFHWWSPDRASGIRAGPLQGGYAGSEQLITVDAGGNIVEERNIPYMQSGAVRPGGGWLAYATRQQITDTPLYGSDPETTYLLNLQTGQRLQITASGEGPDVYSWSPDGNWFLMRGCRNGICGSMLVSVDGLETVIVEPNDGWGMWDAVWSRDSKHIAYSHQGGGCEEPNQPCVPYSSQVVIVDVPARKSVNVDTTAFAAAATGMMMQPAWSPDGSLLTLLSYDPACSPFCSGTTPAVYIMSTSK